MSSVFFNFFFENKVSKFGKVLKFMFLKAGQKRLQRIQNSVNSFTTAEVFAPSNVYNQCKLSMRFYHSVLYTPCAKLSKGQTAVVYADILLSISKIASTHL